MGCKIGDGPTGTASYLVDTPDGGIVVIQNNRSANGPKAGNHSAAIAIGAEGVDGLAPEIRVEGNQLGEDGACDAIFVVKLTAMPALLRDNHFRGHVRPLRGDGEVLP